MQFIDLAAQQDRLREKIEARIAGVLAKGQYIMGPEIAELEAGLAAFADVPHAIGCANGTDALRLAVMTLGAGPGDAIFCPAFTFAATAGIIPPFGATPVFVDIDPATWNMDAGSLARAIDGAKAGGLTPRGAVIVDIFGRPADYDALLPIARDAGCWVIADCAQSFGARTQGRSVVGMGDIATTSFFPAKPLGCYGDGGALFTTNPDHDAHLRSLRVHGKGTDKYDNVRIGLNSRLDTLQAAILLEKLAVFADEIEARERVAKRYTAALAGIVQTPAPSNDLTCTWAQYSVVLPEGTDRKALQLKLHDKGIPTAIYYAKPLHLQTAFEGALSDPEGMTVSETVADRVLALPMHPYLGEADQDGIIAALTGTLGTVS